jgi:hypothetical protein
LPQGVNTVIEVFLRYLPKGIAVGFMDSVGVIVEILEEFLTLRRTIMAAHYKNGCDGPEDAD